jgi:hypothetical protein
LRQWASRSFFLVNEKLTAATTLAEMRAVKIGVSMALAKFDGFQPAFDHMAAGDCNI